MYEDSRTLCAHANNVVIEYLAISYTYSVYLYAVRTLITFEIVYI